MSHRFAVCLMKAMQKSKLHLRSVVMKISIFWDITPCSLVKVNRHFGGTYCLHLQGRRISQTKNQHQICFAFCLLQANFLLGYSSSLKMKAICFSKTLADCHQTAQHYMPEERTYHEPEDLEQWFFFSRKKCDSIVIGGGVIFFSFIYLQCFGSWLYSCLQVFSFHYTNKLSFLWFQH
jgi:hypothetical protein